MQKLTVIYRICSIKILLTFALKFINDCNPMKKLILFANAIALAGFISSCGNSNDNADGTGTDSTAVDSSAMTVTTDEPQEYISIPAPDEMFSFMKDIGGEGKSTTYLNNPDNYKNYSDTKSKALNFGIYATDFLYCSTFDYGTDALKYFVNVKKLGDDLGISGVINQSTADRIKNNIGKNDSLTDISNTRSEERRVGKECRL